MLYLPLRHCICPVHLLCLLVVLSVVHALILLAARGPFFPQSLTVPHSLVQRSHTDMVFWYFFLLNDGQTEGRICHWHHLQIIEVITVNRGWQCHWHLSILVPWLRRFWQNAKIEKANKIVTWMQTLSINTSSWFKGHRSIGFGVLPSSLLCLFLSKSFSGFLLMGLKYFFPPPCSLGICLTRVDYSFLRLLKVSWYVAWLPVSCFLSNNGACWYSLHLGSWARRIAVSSRPALDT